MTIDYRLTETYENYLEAIYNMRDEGQKIINARLADRLGVKPPTVSQTLQRMARDGLVKINGDITLTKYGNEVAEASIRRHRIIERFMSDILGIEWAVAHREAERLQHAISPLIEDKMLAALGHPTYGSYLPIIIGKVNAPLWMERAKLEAKVTLRSDPRIQSIGAVAFSVRNDAIYMEADVYPINQTAPLKMNILVG